ncbi:tRNA (adenine37-N6)-methyltransferase [Marinagarivorans cellulosilyticus]|uniref:tRNA (Adenine37-N6)-methyltransferase n=1 Tax=Marinagarivorans cellulosilyticus TaxID=2721545 RepID=A0AAN2BLD1_9GAMM|nr:tRNA (adenine37-N6)-methyltransferase [Marinagarivorans cellulosilyticus]
MGVRVDKLTLTPIAIIHSCFTEKFGIPRQPGVVSHAKAAIELLPPYNDPATIEGLEGVSHIWVQFLFHANRIDGWKAKVKPPRLGGNKSMGVFATRSPVRPNPLGLSVVTLDSVVVNEKKGCASVVLNISGHDFLNGTPVVDIKPYVPYADCLPEAVNAFATAPPEKMDVQLLPAVQSFCQQPAALALNLQPLIEQILAQNPRPAYQKNDPQRYYGMRIHQWNVRWRYKLCPDSGREFIVVESIGA